MIGKYEMDDCGFPDWYYFNKDGTFRYYREDCEGEYYGIGAFSIINDSLILYFGKADCNKIKTKIKFVKSKNNNRTLTLRIFRKYIFEDVWQKEKGELSISLYDSAGNCIWTSVMASKNGKYIINIKDLSTASYLILGNILYQERINLPLINDSSLKIKVRLYDQFFSDLFQDQKINAGRITVISNSEFILNKWGYDMNYIKTENYLR